MSWLTDIFTGQDPTISGNINKFGQEGGFAQQQGQGDTTAASKFYQDILSDDPSKQAEALAPAISAGQQQTQQQAKTNAEFGNRGGGTNASTQGASAADRTNLFNEVGGLKSSAAGGAASLGTAQQGIALNAQQAQNQAAQQQMENFINSILGKQTAGAINYATSFLPVPHGG